MIWTCLACGGQANGYQFCDRCNTNSSQWYLRGAAVAFGLMGMAEAIRARPASGHRCRQCGYDQTGPHPDAGYNGDLYPCTDGHMYCGLCADEGGKTNAGPKIYGPRAGQW